MNNKELVLGYMPRGTGELYPFDAIFQRSINWLREPDAEIDALVVWGGEDIWPGYYGQYPHSQNDKQGEPSNRDNNEWQALVVACQRGIPIIGVCRGAQLLCAFAGGSLIQHVTGHHSTHTVTIIDGDIMETSSCHHQMMYPWDVEHELLAWSTKNRSSCYEGEYDKPVEGQQGRPEPECVYFPEVKGLAIQGHPEWMGASEDYVVWCNKQIETLLLKKEEYV